MKNVAAKKPWENVCSLQEVNKKNFLNPLGKRNLKQNSMLCVFMRTYFKTVDFPYIIYRFSTTSRVAETTIKGGRMISCTQNKPWKTYTRNKDN